MTISLREPILARLLEILEAVEQLKETDRNLDEFPEAARPMGILLDGDEAAVPEFQRSWVKGKVTIVTDMLPLVLVQHGGTPQDIGSDMNELVDTIIHDVMSDATLSSMVTRNGGVYWDRTDYRLCHSLAMDCDMQIQFRIRYPRFFT